MLVCAGCSELVLYVHLEISKLLILLLRYVQEERLTGCALASHTLYPDPENCTVTVRDEGHCKQILSQL